jgi:hypothetical protein
MGLYNPKWALILEDKFSLSGNAKRSNPRKERKTSYKKKIRL